MSARREWIFTGLLVGGVCLTLIVLAAIP